MELKGERLIPASVDTTWRALNDPAILRDCIAGCESIERTGDDAYEALIAVKVGPVSARFKGKLQMSDIKPPNSYTIHFEGQGGVAGHGKGSADVALSEEGQQTRLRYEARAQVGGKMAQVGSRLIDAAAGKLTEDFFSAFEARLKPTTAGEVVAAPAAPTEAPSRMMWWLAGAVLVLGLIFWWVRR
jgi:uncharacterized protein